MRRYTGNAVQGHFLRTPDPASPARLNRMVAGQGLSRAFSTSDSAAGSELAWTARGIGGSASSTSYPSGATSGKTPNIEEGG